MSAILRNADMLEAFVLSHFLHANGCPFRPKTLYLACIEKRTQ